MPYLRSVRKAAWADLDTGSAEAIADAVGDLIDRGTWTSVFVCNSRADLEWIAVALSATRAHRRKFDYVEIDDAEVVAAGIEVRMNEGRTPLARVNALHRELDLADGRAEKLVRVLAARPLVVRSLRIDELRAVAALLMKTQQIPLDPGHWLRR